MMDGKMDCGIMCKCPHHKVLPLLVVAFGLTFLLGAMGTITIAQRDIAWPIIVILAGFMKMSGGMCGCYKDHMKQM